jgi:hypothetical protein
MSFPCLLFTFVEAKRIQFCRMIAKLFPYQRGDLLIVGAADTLICEPIVPHGPECFPSSNVTFTPWDLQTRFLGLAGVVFVVFALLAVLAKMIRDTTP